jgi:ribose/xylose/arabinose/galactoside ABC-type transport system permease subunit
VVPFVVTLGMLPLRGAAKGLAHEMLTGLIIVAAVALDRLRRRRA